MPETNESLINLVNASGFLFQIRIQQEIVNTVGIHGWAPVGYEHRWTDQEGGSEGFIDLVLGRELTHLVLECKRERDAVWTFLTPTPTIDDVERARLNWIHYERGQELVRGWDEFTLTSPSPESSFCVVRGQGDRDKPMLERLAGLVLRSVENLADEEARLIARNTSRSSEWRIYVPIIVTTAQLYTCEFDPNRINILDGQLEQANADFKSVPFIRFRKSFETNLDYSPAVVDLERANRAGERTILVVHADDLIDMIKPMRILLATSVRRPWDIVRGRDTPRS